MKTNGQYGVAVSVHGDTALIGATNQAPANSFLFQTGAVYTYLRTGTTWNKGQELIPTDAASQDYFGDAIAFDGAHAVF